jgi:hypothetical protein
VSAVASEVDAALEELEEEFPGAVSSEPDGAGGTYITIEGVGLGGGWSVSEAPLSFHLPYNYPFAAPYPYYLPAGVIPKQGMVEALQQVHWQGREMIQVSLRHNNWDPERDRVLGCMRQVSAWFLNQ